MTKKVIGSKEDAAEYCWTALTEGRDADEWKRITDGLLAHAASMAFEAGYKTAGKEAARYIAEHCWKEGFIAALAALEHNCFERVEVRLPQGSKGGVN
jgi:hypothetical protein